MSNDQSSFHVIDLKLGIEPSLTPHRLAARLWLQHDARRCAACACCTLLRKHGARWSVLMNIYAQTGLTIRIKQSK